MKTYKINENEVSANLFEAVKANTIDARFIDDKTIQVSLDKVSVQRFTGNMMIEFINLLKEESWKNGRKIKSL